MPFKDAFGIWREDEFRTHWKREDPVEAKSCPHCGRDMHLDREPIDCEYDWELDQDWALSSLQRTDPSQATLLKACLRFHYQIAICDKCGGEVEYGRCTFFNPVTQRFDMQRPLTREAAEKQELVYQRQQQEAAGQLRLFP